jgi:hypothetical protein
MSERASPNGYFFSARDFDRACVLAAVKGRSLRSRPALRAGFAPDSRCARQAAGASPASSAAQRGSERKLL